jgi:hypothetical protein
MWKGIQGLREVIWITEIMLEEWHMTIICPVHKKAEKLECSNYRGILLLNVSYNILANILTGSIHKRDFRGIQTTDHLFALRLMMEKAYEFGIYFIYCLLIFDAVEGKYFNKTLREFGTPKKRFILVEITYIDCDCNVRIQGHISKR